MALLNYIKRSQLLRNVPWGSAVGFVYERGGGSIDSAAPSVLGRAGYPTAQLAQKLCCLPYMHKAFLSMLLLHGKCSAQKTPPLQCLQANLKDACEVPQAEHYHWLDLVKAQQQQGAPAPSSALPLRKAKASMYWADVLSEEAAQAACSSTHCPRSWRGGRASALPSLETSRPCSTSMECEECPSAISDRVQAQAC